MLSLVGHGATVHVPLRHRLLLKPGGFEGLGPFAEHSATQFGGMF
jgi:hypothetical protein